MASKSTHYVNVRDWPATVSAAAKARITKNVTDDSHPAAKLYWWREEEGTPEGCKAFCDNLVAGALKRGVEAFEAATGGETSPASSVSE